jgi:hypothetical protein
MARTILIGYDLNQPEQIYAPLIDEIKRLGSTWWHCLDSTWIVKTELSVEQVRNRLRTKIDQNDELLVIAAPREASWIGFDKNCGDWLTTHLTT